MAKDADYRNAARILHEETQLEHSYVILTIKKL